MPSGGGGQTAFGGQGQSGYGGNSWGMGPQQGQSQSQPQAQPQPAGDVSSLYTSLLGRAPDPAGQAYWQHLADTGTSMQDIGQGMYATPEGQARAATDYVPMNKRPGFQPQPQLQQSSMFSPSSQQGNMYGGAGWGGGLGQLLSSLFGGGSGWGMFNQPMSFPQQGPIFRPSSGQTPGGAFSGVNLADPNSVMV